MVEQRTLGQLLLVVSTTCYIYYTVWMLFTPLIDEDHSLQNYFPDRIYGVMVPTMLGYLLISIIITSSGIILLTDVQRK